MTFINMSPIATAWFKLLRPTDWLHFLFLPLMTISFAEFNGVCLVSALIGAAIYLAFAYGYNEYKDSGLYKWNREALREYLGVGHVGIWLAWIVLIALGLAVTGLCGASSQIAMLSGVIGSYLYSGGPRLKRFPVIGTLANLWIFLPVALLGGQFSLVAAAPWLLGVFSLLLIQNQLIHEATHRQEDRRDNIRTSVVVFGNEFARYGSASLGLCAAVCMAGFGWIHETSILFVPALILALFSGIYPFACLFVEVSSLSRLRLLQRYVGVACGAVFWIGTIF